MDLADAEHETRFSDLLEVVEDQNLPYPLVSVNGELKLAGSAHYFRVLPLVEGLLSAETEKAQG